MSNVLWWVPITAGIQDGLNPCALMNAALVLLGIIWFRNNGIKFNWIFLFIGTLITVSFLSNCGFLDKVIIHKNFLHVTRSIYVLLAIFVGIKGFKFLFQWFQLTKGNSIKEEILIKRKVSPGFLGFSIVFFGLFLSVLSSLWPTNYFISYFSVYMLTPDQAIPMGVSIAVYSFISKWLIFFILWFVSIQSKSLRLFKITASAILLSASISVIDLFL